MKRIMTKSEINELLSALMGEYEIIAPVLVSDERSGSDTNGGLVLFQPVKDVEQILWDYGNSSRPAKELFFPPRETLFIYSDHPLQIPEAKHRQTIVWGLRPCDVRSLLILDKVFNGDYKDVYYLRRRENSILMGLACENPQKTCLCTSFDPEGPFSSEGLDALFVKLDDETYLAELISNKGVDLLKGYGKEAKTSHVQEKERLAEEAKVKIVKGLTIPGDLESIFENEYWDKVSRKCISCGVCRFLCATCHCFSLTDEERERIRFHDACAFPSFTREAAGTNPRAQKVSRYKQWYYHKFCYHKKTHGEYLCVGCGRCIRNCPVKIDFTEVLKSAVHTP